MKNKYENDMGFEFPEAAELLFDKLYAPLGEYAPLKRRVVIDFKDENGNDAHVAAVIYRDPQDTDIDLVHSVKDEYARRGCKLSAITLLEDGKPPQVLYYALPCRRRPQHKKKK